MAVPCGHILQGADSQWRCVLSAVLYTVVRGKNATSADNIKMGLSLFLEKSEAL